MTVSPPRAASAGLAAYFADRAAAVDEGEADVREGLRWLGRHGLIGLGAPGDSDGRFGAFTEVVAGVAAQCLSSAFSLWGQHMVIEYLERAAVREFAEPLLPALRDGELVGSSAMAPALRELAGIAPVPVYARRAAGGYVLGGPVRWASNLFDGAVIVLPARAEDGARLVVALTVGTPGLRVAPYPRLLALGATASSSARLEDVFVPDPAVLTMDFRPFVRGARPFFLLSQAAFCAGLAGESLRQAKSRLVGPGVTLVGDIREAEERHERVRARLEEFARSPAGPAAHEDLLRLRLDAMDTAVRAAGLELAAGGGSGFAMQSPTCRRFREAAFLRVQAPTEGELRWALQYPG